jgi:RNA recognition motif-containing protein
VIGKIISLKLSQHPQKSFKHAYVLYETVSEAQRAIQKFHDSTVFGSRPIHCDFWLSRQEILSEKNQKNENDLNRLLKNLFHQHQTP